MNQGNVKKDTRGLSSRNQVQALWDWFWDLTQPHLGNVVLELGCGTAQLAPRIVQTANRYIGVDYATGVINLNRKNYEKYNRINFYQEDITSETFGEFIAEQDVDTILGFNVLEHVEQDERVLNNCFKGLLSGGLFVAISPSHPLLYGTSDKAAGHYRRYSFTSFRSIFEKVGFKRVKLHHMNFVGLLPLIVRNTLLDKTKGYFESQSSLSLKLHNLIIPLLHSLENFLKPPVGTSLFGVFAKPEGN